MPRQKTTTPAAGPAIGHNSGGVLDPAKLRSFVERVETIESEIANLSEDRKSLYAEAALAGIDKAALKEIIRVRRLDEDKKREWETRRETIDTYMASLGALFDRPLGQSALQRSGLAPPV